MSPAKSAKPKKHAGEKINAPPKVVRRVEDLRKLTGKWRRSGKSIAVVPTMGALHDGHIALVKRATKIADRVIVSIFVNPTQFAASEDLSRYPRDEAHDLARLATTGADLVWAPTVDEMYPAGFSCSVTPGSAAEGLEGAIRPAHFQGVTTVCCKLFSQTEADFAMFGEKDYQQLAVLRQMVRDLNLPVELVPVATKREHTGLALSSRNRYLSDAERAIAPKLYETLSVLAADIKDGADIATALTNGRRRLLDAGFAKVDYLEVRDATDFSAPGPTRVAKQKLRLLAAAHLGTTRLIDNVAV